MMPPLFFTLIVVASASLKNNFLIWWVMISVLIQMINFQTKGIHSCHNSYDCINNNASVIRVC